MSALTCSAPRIDWSCLIRASEPVDITAAFMTASPSDLNFERHPEARLQVALHQVRSDRLVLVDVVGRQSVRRLLAEDHEQVRAVEQRERELVPAVLLHHEAGFAVEQERFGLVDV